MMLFQKELKRLGLKDKEAAVYLACLELGPTPVQQISRKAKVVRATTYVVLDSLAARGLVTQYKEGKKTLFSAEPPRQLMRLLEKEVEEISNKKQELEQLLPELQSIMRSAAGKPVVRFFSGREGLYAIRQEIIRYTNSGDVVCNFTPADHLVGVFPDDEDTHYAQRVAKKINARTIFTTRSQSLKERWLSHNMSAFSERRFVSPELFPSTSGMTVFRDRIAIGAFAGQHVGVIIESEVMADMMRRLFDLAWQAAEQA